MTKMIPIVDFALSTDHSASSYGVPVLVIAGRAYGPADDVVWGPYSDGVPAAFLIAKYAFANLYPHGDPDHAETMRMAVTFCRGSKYQMARNLAEENALLQTSGVALTDGNQIEF